ncbi:MAG: hypothetical protein KC766_08540, partial [Myxococcales bacterium]|nr:hypothetical protein [Myxococcales bacterium]
PRWPWVVCGWGAFTALCFAIATDRVPIGAWVSAAMEPAARAAPARPPGTTAFAPAPQSAPLTAAREHRTEAGSAADLSATSAPQPRLPARDVAASQPAGRPEAATGEAGAGSEPSATSQLDLPAPPKVDTLPGAAPALPSPPTEETPKAIGSQSSAGTSCEAAIERYQEEIRIGGPAAPPDLSRAHFASVLENGSYFSHCGVPDAMSLEICAAVRDGRAVGVTIRSTPGDRRIQACVARAVRGLSFPAHPRLDVTRTRFAAE